MKTSVNNQIKPFDQNTSTFNILHYYSDSPIFAPESLFITLYLQPLIRNLWPYSKPPTLDPHLRTYSLYLTFSMHLWTSPTLEINRHQIPTSEGATLKLKPHPFYMTYLRSSEAPDYFQYMFWQRGNMNNGNRKWWYNGGWWSDNEVKMRWQWGDSELMGLGCRQ